MGICIHPLGEINIPKEHRAEYAQQALKLLCVGGMMTVEPLQLYGHKLYLLSPPEVDKEGRANGYYNYLDNSSGESWCLDGENGGFGCGKINGDCFYATVAAVHVLTTLCSTSYATTVIDGRLVREQPCIGWINHVLGTQYTNQRATELWEIGKLLHLDHNYWVRRNPDLCPLMEDFPPECVDWDQTEAYLAAYHFDELCSMFPPLTEEEWAELLKSKTVTIRLIYNHLQYALQEYHQNDGTLEQAKKCLLMSTEEKMQTIHPQKVRDKPCLPFAFLMAPPAFSVACIAKEFNTTFWELWDEIGEQIPDGLRFNAPEPCPVVKPIPTWRFFDKSPDDFVYYWKKDGELPFSDGLKKQMTEWRSELDAITEGIPPQDFLRTLADSISAGGSIFFRDTFYDFIARQAERKVQSAVILMGRLAEQNSSYGRQYQALLANKELRQQVLGF